MSNLDLIGEMSLEQLENNVEALFGKAKAEELLHILHTTDVDASMKNKFYAAILNNIKSQNSIDNILKNPNFQKAEALWNYMQSYEQKDINENDHQNYYDTGNLKKEYILLRFFLVISINSSFDLLP